MRTTLTLDEDVAAQLSRLRNTRKGVKLKDLINEALRYGLKQMMTPQRPSTLYSTQAVSLGRCLVGSLDDVAEVLAIAEGEAFR
ncbi:MAG: hypothetical protein D6704_10230 [Nitrospirae bacterium]|nr:MAG: hypothetical protein D6704_10230 [Nitrospirota bacterium]